MLSLMVADNYQSRGRGFAERQAGQAGVFGTGGSMPRSVLTFCSNVDSILECVVDTIANSAAILRRRQLIYRPDEY